MLNKENVRELAYVVKINDIKPISGSDNCEAAVVGGWNIMVRKGTFKPNDLAIYFEIDSKVPETEVFSFLADKHYKVKTQKYTFGGKGNFISQGLLMHPNDFGWEVYDDMGWEAENAAYLGEGNGEKFIYVPNENLWMDEYTFLTEKLGVIYSVAEDNHRKAKTPDKYTRMVQRMGKKSKKWPYHWLLRHAWGKKFLYVFYSHLVNKTNWPDWVKKTDEERVQNMSWILNDKSEWIATEKIDGSSTTFTLRRKKHSKKKFDFYVCSRNVVFDTPDKPCFYDENIYFEMAKKYKIREALEDFLMKTGCEWVTLQGETYGPGVQRRDYSTPERAFMGFNLITDRDGRWNSSNAKETMGRYSIPWVPILDEHYILPDTIEELLEYVHGESICDYQMREGIVFRSKDGIKSFKCVDPEFLLKYHG